ncbi:MAG: roadblock/LC7 domain-containing protein [Candidatus Lokiarchaeota archaeon]|nr:roadblock/LC7 domain-containing protein [Candidatus Lokiarchaeota archaeon]
MKSIEGIFVVDKVGKVIFPYGEEFESLGKNDKELLSGFVSAFQSLARELGEEEMKEARLGTSKLFFTKDRISEISFVIKATIYSRQKKMFQILEKIKNLFINTFIGHMHEENEAIKYLLDSFSINLEKLLSEQPDTKVKGFFDGL